MHIENIVLPKARQEGLLVKAIGDELIVYDKERRQAHRLNKSAALVWRHCDGQMSISEMATLLKSEMQLPAEEGLVWQALDRLEQTHLLKDRMTKPTDIAGMTRREFLKLGAKFGVAAGFAMLYPVVESIMAPNSAKAQQPGDDLWPVGCISGVYSPSGQLIPADLPDLSFASASPLPITDPAARHVNQSHPNAQDLPTQGDVNNPWKTIGYAASTLQPGQVAYVHPGIYYERISTGIDGSVDNPIWLIAEPGVVMTDPSSGSQQPFIRIQSDYWIVDGFEIDGKTVPCGDDTDPDKPCGRAIYFEGTNHAIARNIHAHNGRTNGAVEFSEATHVALLDSRIHEYEWPGEDSPAIVVTDGSEKVLIKGNDCWKNFGDSVLCTDPKDFEPNLSPNPPKHITIEGNTFHEDDENAVDLKSCQSVTIRGNKFYGYRPAIASKGGSPKGDAIVVHFNADGVIIEGNEIWDCGRAASIGATNGQVGTVVFRFNIIHDMKVVQDSTGDTRDTGSGIEVTLAKRVEIYHNTFYNLPFSPGLTSGYGIRIGVQGSGSYTDLAAILNNIIMDAGIGLNIYTPNIGKLASDRNLFYRTNKLKNQPFVIDDAATSLLTWQGRGYECTSTIADPLFVDAAQGDFHTQAGPPASPARDNAILTDITLLNFCGSAPDIGALESCP